MTTRILTGDCRDILAAMPAATVDCVVTSPPYWGLRSYLPNGHADKPRELGCEPTLGEHIATMVAVFEDVRRVLKSSGTVWLNYGDCYAASVNGRSAADTKAAGNDDRTFRDKPFSTVGGALKPKDLCMVPNRLAIALQEAGWWVRSEIIWAKPNPMPESVRDRPTSAHEKLWLLTKSERYFYDAEAIAEPASYGGLNGQDDSGFKSPLRFNGKAADFADYARTGKRDKQRGHSRRHAGFNDRWDQMERAEQCSGMRNRRNVWTIPSQPFSDAHFATFPPALVEPCVSAGCPQKVCAKCGKPWVRRVAKSFVSDGKSAKRGLTRDANDNRHEWGNDHGTWDITTLGFRPSCHCKAGTMPGTVLDPFGGAGTVGMVADRLGRDAILIELNPAYAAMAQSRIVNDLPLFAEVFL